MIVSLFDLLSGTDSGWSKDGVFLGHFQLLVFRRWKFKGYCTWRRPVGNKDWLWSDVVDVLLLEGQGLDQVAFKLGSQLLLTKCAITFSLMMTVSLVRPESFWQGTHHSILVRSLGLGLFISLFIGHKILGPNHLRPLNNSLRLLIVSIGWPMEFGKIIGIGGRDDRVQDYGRSNIFTILSRW